MLIPVVMGLAALAAAMNPLPIIVRRATNALLIEVRVKGRPPKTLQRPPTEALARSLNRVSKAFVPSKKSGKGSKQASEPCVLLDPYGAELDSSMSALEAWLGAAQLRIGQHTQLNVLCEPAEVVSVALPSAPLVGVPLAPFVEARDCAAAQCRFTWERLPPGSAADEWQIVSFERLYAPTEGDIGARLRVRAAPPISAHDEYNTLSFLARVAEATERVERAPPRRLLARRVCAHTHAFGLKSLGQALHWSLSLQPSCPWSIACSSKSPSLDFSLHAGERDATTARRALPRALVQFVG